MSATESIADKVKPHFLRGGRFADRYDPSTEPFRDVVPGGTCETLIYPKGSQAACMLRVFDLGETTSDLVKAHWQNEIRALLRVSALRHPNLPVLKDAGIMAAESLGYLIIDDTGTPILVSHPVMKTFRTNRVSALREFVGLVEAVHILHKSGMVHRTITPESVRANESSDSRIKLDSFQMSAFVATWLLGRGTSDEMSPGQLRPTSPECRVYLAPERVGPLFGETYNRLEGFGVDVFGLGMLGAAWFIEAAHDRLAEMASLVFHENQYEAELHRDLILEVHSIIRASILPQKLQRLLTTMTAYMAGNRPASASGVHDNLKASYGALLAWAEGAHDSVEPHRIHYLTETVGWLYREQVAASPPEHPDYEEYNEFIERDLQDGVMTWSPTGFRAWQTIANREAVENARIVLIGKSYAYFCQYLVREVDGPSDERAIVIKFPIHVSKIAGLNRVHHRAVPRVAASHFVPGSRARPTPTSTPSWGPLVDSIRTSDSDNSETPVERACAWLLRMNQSSTAFAYACNVVGRATQSITLESVDLTQVMNDPETNAFLELWRRVKPPGNMADDFLRIHEDALEQGERARFELLARPDDRVPLAELAFEDKINPKTARFTCEANDTLRVDAPYWIRKANVSGAVVAQRQRQAVDHASRNRLLIAQLQSPHAVQLSPKSEYEHILGDIEEPARALLSRMLTSWPMFAIQGPPGTGKTHVAAQYLKALMQSDPFSRVIVSAQSHHALDNLIGQIERAVGKDVMILRATTPHTRSRIGQEGEAHLPARLLESIRADIAAASPVVDARTRPLQKQWQKAAKDNKLDLHLAQRLNRSASIIGITANSVSHKNLGTPDIGTFDVAVIEEAARGWLTEMLVPIVHANRWVIIGDHRQLPPFDAEAIDRALKIDIEHKITEESTEAQVTPDMQPYLRWFEHIMTTPLGRKSEEPRHLLGIQRRMHPTIGTMVSQAFYGGVLESHPSTSARKATEIFDSPLASFNLCWINTSMLNAYESSLTNHVEVEIVKRVLDILGTARRDGDPAVPPLYVLSPYVDQLKKLQNYIKIKDGVHFATVDSVQGRQAEVVVVSLTRNNSFEEPSKGLGFLVYPERVNVMLSRARRLLIIVGSLRHFGRFKVDHWDKIVAFVRDRKLVFDPASDPIAYNKPGRTKGNRR